MPRRTVDDELAELAALARNPAAFPAASARVAQALQSRTSLIAAKAADIVAKQELHELGRDVVAMFQRFFKDPKYPDKGCVARTAAARALLELGEYAAGDVFLAGAHHVQRDTLGDSACDLRGICGMGLVRINHPDALSNLVERLEDREASVRSAAARALAYSGTEDAALLLRHKLLVGDRENDVIADCLVALVQLQRSKAMAFLKQFLNHESESIRTATALALGESREATALPMLLDRCGCETDAETRRAILLAIAMLRTPAAITWLIEQIKTGRSRPAAEAVEALAISKHDRAIRERVEAAVTDRDDSGVRAAMEEHWGIAS